jgi:SAM-dependent methyltransferase
MRSAERPRIDLIAGTMTSAAAAGFEQRTCTAPAERVDRMRDIVLAQVLRDRPIAILDVGSGTGALVLRLAEALPMASLTGIDVSHANIQAATAEQARRLSISRVPPVRFEAADYLQYLSKPFDVIIADGVLHLIPGDTTRLVRKLANDLLPGGLLICSMPFDCAYNRVFAMVRRGLCAVRSRWLDGLILTAGRILHGADMDDDRLRERVAYMYIPPERMMDAAFKETARLAGLRATAEYPMRSTSCAQLTHRVTVFVRARPGTSMEP